jgi:cytoskeleton protein RodZ
MIEKNGNEAAMPKLGARLRQGREALGLTLEEAGRRLHLPHQVVRRIENDDLAALGAPVFVRGYLRSYARLVGIAEHELEQSWELPQDPPPLVATGTVPLSRRLVERYTRGSLYAMLSAVTIVPIVVLALGGHLSGEARLESLDHPHPPASPLALPVTGPIAELDAQIFQGPPSPVAATDAERRTVVASMLPAPRAPSRLPEARSEPPLLRLLLDERSWVEVNAAGGQRLEFAMLPAGSERSYPGGADLAVSIGNAQGARVEVNGEEVDIGSHRRANVARFRVSSDGRLLPPSGG